MKRGFSLFLIFTLISIIFSTSFASAGWFSNFIGKITGNPIAECIDTDVSIDYPDGKNPFVKGIASIPGDEREDHCSGEDRYIYREAYCSFFGIPLFYAAGCPEGYVCVDGACTNCFFNCTGKECGNDGCGGSCGSCEVGKSCVEGVCTGEISCIDSDVSDGYPNGLNPYVKGNASLSDGSNIIEDSCGTNINTVIEGFCNPQGTPTTTVYICPTNYICQEGICSFQEPECKDTDSLNYNLGLNYHQKGICTKSGIELEDKCISEGEHNGWLKEYYCFGNVCDSKEYNCPYGCSNGKCLYCVSNCTEKECGDNGCGGSCGSCEQGEGCINNQCIECSPNCTGKQCGDNGCGGSCGRCGVREICITNKCVNDCEDTDVNVDYPDGKNPYVRGTTITKSEDSEIEDYCDSNYQDILKEAYCGSFGGTYYAMGCLNGCEEGHCLECSPNCTGKECGNDGCEGSCGRCEQGEDCINNHCVECSPNCTGKECGNDGCEGSCGRCGVGEICVEGQCSIRENEKNISQYSDKEVFLISDKDWKEVLPLIPITTWTGNESCQKAYGTPDNVCVYPTLIYHKEDYDEEDLCLTVSNSDFRFDIFPSVDEYFYNGELDGNTELSSNSICPGEFLNMTITLENIGTNDIYIGNLSIKDYPIQLQPLTENIIIDRTLHPGDVEVIVAQFYYPINNSFNNSIFVFDADSIIHFMQQYSPEKVSIIGGTPQELDDLLIASPDLGAGLEEENLQRISIENYLSYWENFNDIVYVEDNYGLALIASTYASLINAPLIIEGSILDEESIFENKNIICVGDVNLNGTSCSEEYNLIELQEEYFQKTDTDKVILINPNDLEVKVEEEFKPEKSSNPIRDLFNKISLSSPILASAKHELLLSLDTPPIANERCTINQEILNKVQEIDNFVDSSLNSKSSSLNFLTIFSQPLSLPDSICDNPNGDFRISKDDEYAYLDSSSKQLNVGRIYGITLSDVSSYVARDLFYDVLSFDKYGNNSTGLSLGYYWDSGRIRASYIKQKTSSSGYNSLCNYDMGILGPNAFYDNKIAFISDKEGLVGLYIYDVNNEEFIKISGDETNFLEEGILGNKLDINFFGLFSMHQNKIIWQSFEVTNTSIWMYDLVSGLKEEVINLERNYIASIYNIHIFNNKIIYRYGDFGKDIYMIDLDVGSPELITSGFLQGFYDNKIIFSKVSQKDIYLYNLDTSEELEIANSQNSIIRANIFGDYVVWNEYINGYWQIFLYNISSNIKEQISEEELGKSYLPYGIYENYILWIERENSVDKYYIYNINTKTKERINIQNCDYKIINDGKVICGDDSRKSIKYYDIDSKTIETVNIDSPCETSVHSLEGKQYITYAGHGSSTGWQGPRIGPSDLGDLDLSYSFAAACLTSDFWWGGKNTFSVNFLRKGGLGYQGSTGTSWSSILNCNLKALMEMTQQDISIGEVNTNLYSLCNHYFKEHFILMGDPTLNLNLRRVIW